MGINTVGAWGSQQGFTAVNFMLCYMAGAYFNINKIEIKGNEKRALLSVYVVNTLLIFAGGVLCECMTLFGLHTAW